MEFITLERNGSIVVLTINRPEALNALNTDVLGQLDFAITEIEADDGILVVVLTGAGRAFVAGADIGEMKGYSAIEGKRFGQYGSAVFSRLEDMTKPVIAAVNGFALGGGSELAMACDIRLAGQKAKFGMPEVGLGITPGFGGTQRLPRIVGVSKAMELILTSKTIDAQEAKTIGLVSEVYPQDELMPAAMALAETIARQPQVAVRQAKRAILKGMQADITTGLAFESESFGLCFSTEDQTDSMSAFLNKEKIETFKNK